MKRSFSNTFQSNLADYYQWLKNEGIVKEAFIPYPEPKVEKKNKNDYTQHHPSKKKINSYDEVRFFDDDSENRYAHTTIDRKYALEKVRKGKPSDYTYKIHDIRDRGVKWKNIRQKT